MHIGKNEMHELEAKFTELLNSTEIESYREGFDLLVNFAQQNSNGNLGNKEAIMRQLESQVEDYLAENDLDGDGWEC